MVGSLLFGIFLSLAPVAHALELWDDGGKHFVDTVVTGISAVRDSAGGAPTTVILVAGTDVTDVVVEDSSVFAWQLEKSHT